MVKTTKILLIFMQTFEWNVGKKIFFGGFVGKEENRKGAIKPWPLCTPLGLFLGVLGCGGVRLLTCVCMLRCWMCEVEPMCVDADGVGCGRRGALLSPGWGFFLFFGCGGVGVTCIVEYWDALYRVFYRIFWKRNDDFFGFVQVFWFVWLVADVL